jgi:hypothetical protein
VSQPEADPDLHPAVLPLIYLLGTWRGEGVVGYPTIGEDRAFAQEITFGHSGKAFLAYASRTWDPATGEPMAAETGYFRPQPDDSLEVLLVHPTGIAELYLGRISGAQLEMATDAVLRSATAKEVTASRRLYGLVEGALMYAVDMAMMGQPLQPHFSAKLERVPGSGVVGFSARGTTKD